MVHEADDVSRLMTRLNGRHISRNPDAIWLWSVLMYYWCFIWLHVCVLSLYVV